MRKAIKKAKISKVEVACRMNTSRAPRDLDLDLDSPPRSRQYIGDAVDTLEICANECTPNCASWAVLTPNPQQGNST